MPLSKVTHDETGEHWIISTPNPEYAGKRLNVLFVDGEGRTKDILKAREFSEIYGYEVIPYTGAPDLGIQQVPELSPGERPEWSDEAPPKTAIEAALDRNDKGQFKPRKVTDEMKDEKEAFGRAVGV